MYPSLSKSGSVAGNSIQGLLGNSGPGGLAGLISKPKQINTSITPFVPGTQSTIQGEPNLLAPDRGNGTPSLAGNVKSSGSAYFQGLLNSPNPAERQAGQTWMSHQTTPGLLPKHPVKSITTSPNGTTKHTFDTKTNIQYNPNGTPSTGGSSTPPIQTPPPVPTPTPPPVVPPPTPTPPTTPTTPQVGSPTQNAQNVLNASNLANNPQYQGYINQNNELYKESLGANTAGIGGTPIPGVGTNNPSYQNLFAPQTTANLQGEKNVFNTNNSIQQGANAQSIQNLQQAAGIATGGAENVLGASTYSPTSYGLTNTSGLTGVQDAGNYGSGPGAAANVQSIKDLTSQYNQGLVNLKAADGIQNQIVSTLNANPTLNNQPLSAITNLNELLSGQVSSGPQQQLSQQIASYINTLGLDPASVANIAHQQQGTLADLLDSLRKTAQTQNDAKNPANLNIPGASNSSNTSGSTGGGFSEGMKSSDGSLVYKGGKWVKA